MFSVMFKTAPMITRSHFNSEFAGPSLPSTTLQPVAEVEQEGVSGAQVLIGPGFV